MTLLVLVRRGPVTITQDLTTSSAAGTSIIKSPTATRNSISALDPVMVKSNSLNYTIADSVLPIIEKVTSRERTSSSTVTASKVSDGNKPVESSSALISTIPGKLVAKEHLVELTAPVSYVRAFTKTIDSTVSFLSSLLKDSTYRLTSAVSNTATQIKSTAQSKLSTVGFTLFAPLKAATYSLFNKVNTAVSTRRDTIKAPVLSTVSNTASSIRRAYKNLTAASVSTAILDNIRIAFMTLSTSVSNSATLNKASSLIKSIIVLPIIVFTKAGTYQINATNNIVGILNKSYIWVRTTVSTSVASLLQLTFKYLTLLATSAASSNLVKAVFKPVAAVSTTVLQRIFDITRTIAISVQSIPRIIKSKTSVLASSTDSTGSIISATYRYLVLQTESVLSSTVIKLGNLTKSVSAVASSTISKNVNKVVSISQNISSTINKSLTHTISSVVSALAFINRGFFIELQTAIGNISTLTNFTGTGWAAFLTKYFISTDRYGSNAEREQVILVEEVTSRSGTTPMDQ